MKPELGHKPPPSLPPSGSPGPTRPRTNLSNVSCAALVGAWWGGGCPPCPLAPEPPRAEAQVLVPLWSWCPELVLALRKPAINAIIVVLTLISLKRKPAPRDGMTHPRPHDAGGRAGTGTLGSWVLSLPDTPGCCSSLPRPHRTHTIFSPSFGQYAGSARRDIFSFSILGL